MKTIQEYVLCGVVALLGTWSCVAVEVGDTKDMVLAELGSPPGYVGTPGREVLLYGRGDVVLTDGTVVSVELISQEAFEAERSRRAAEAAEQRVREQVRRERLIKEGTEVRLRKLADTEFMNAPAAERLAYWRRFRMQYPDVVMGEEYAAALRERELELSARSAARASDAYVRELEQRVARAEAQANQGGAYLGGGTTLVSANFAPNYYNVGTHYRRVRRPLRRGCVHGRGVGHCRKPDRPRVEPYHSTAGYAFQRPLDQGAGSDRDRTIYRSPTRIIPVPSTAGYAFQRPLYTAGRSHYTPCATPYSGPVSRGGISARARIAF